jgi:serine protease inhibitor
MHAESRTWRRSGGWTTAVLVSVTILCSGCGTTAAPLSTFTDTAAPPAMASAPIESPGPAIATAPATLMPSAAPTIAPSTTSVGALVPGALAVTVSGDLRVRSQPRVANDSIKLAPLLPKGTQLVVLGGPVTASGYTWVEVAPIGFELKGGVDSGWVAVADHDGTRWVEESKDATPGFELASVTLDRATAKTAGAKAAAIAENAFGIALYKRMAKDMAGHGVVMSPYSIATALAMARAGARGATAGEMDKVLRVSGWGQLGTGLNSLDQLLASRDAAWQKPDWQNDVEVQTQHWLKLRTANMAFGQQGYAIDPAYLERIARAVGAPLGIVDYKADPEAARVAINGWVSRQTLGRIPELLARPDVTDATRLVLVNAVYLKAEWVRPFDPGRTRSESFTTGAGKAIKVPTMTQDGGQAIVLASGTGWRATELRYAGGKGSQPLAMTLILPDNLSAFERAFSPVVLEQVQSKIAAEAKRLERVTFTGHEDDCGMYAYEVRLRLPKFGIDTRADLVQPLATLGMPRAFDADLADFTGMTTQDRLYIGKVIHQANIDVDEQGTTAAAATAIGMDTGGCTGPNPKTTKVLRFDKPFMYLIRDVQTGAILFMGRVMDPSTRN